MRRFAISLTLILFGAALSAAEKPTSEQLDFFEKKVRPLFVSDCIRCHGERKQEAGLRLDTAAGLKKGTDAGPVIVPGDPDKSILIRSVRRVGDYAMPPNKELSKDQVAILEEWVKLGGAFPETAATPPEPDRAKTHWAFQPIRDPAVPPVANATVASPIDAFVVQKLQAKGQTLAPRADKRTLIRRVYFDLIGLPPTLEQTLAFEKDSSPDALAKVVDQLLAMPQYGERWGRHWLDVARYADTKGYVFTEDRNYPYAYTFRDYVIRSLNEDKPYNRFVVEQLAADHLDLKNDNRPLAAMGFLTVGRRFSNNIHDIYDDRIDLIGRGLMGLTISCARCHDHKFDPIPTADYYSLYGVFGNSNEPKDLPIIGNAAQNAEALAVEAELKQLEQKAADYLAKMYAEAIAPYRKAESIRAMLLATKPTLGFPTDKADKWAVANKLDPRILDRWRKGTSNKAGDSVFGLWQEFVKIPDDQFEKQLPDLLTRSAKTANTHVLKSLTEARPKSLEEAATAYANLLARAASGEKVPNADSAWNELVKRMLDPDGITNPLPQDLEKIIPIPTKRVYRKLRNEAAAARAKAPATVPHAMVMVDNDKVREPVVFLRGNPNNRGTRVPLQMPAITIPSGETRQPFQKGSGRLELANAIVSPKNPLTARVIVNRVWMWHFGQAIVRTPSDFGLRSEPPTHPELLDWLATRFMNEDGWSLKKLHKRIILSTTYQQSSETTPEKMQLDPENRLIGRFNRQRLDFESLRDSLLYTGGLLDLKTMGGKSVDLFSSPYTRRRAVYGFVDRQNLPGTFRAFDFASPEQHTPQRFQTTVPQQALFMMNSPFVVEIAQAVNARSGSAANPTEKIRTLYRETLGRYPTAEELQLATEFVKTSHSSPSDRMTVWDQLAQILLLSNEFVFVD